MKEFPSLTFDLNESLKKDGTLLKHLGRVGSLVTEGDICYSALSSKTVNIYIYNIRDWPSLSGGDHSRCYTDESPQSSC